MWNLPNPVPLCQPFFITLQPTPDLSVLPLYRLPTSSYYPSTYHLLPLYVFLAFLYYPFTPLPTANPFILPFTDCFFVVWRLSWHYALPLAFPLPSMVTPLTRTPVRVTEAIMVGANTFSISLMKDGGDNFSLLQKQVFIEIFSLAG